MIKNKIRKKRYWRTPLFVLLALLLCLPLSSILEKNPKFCGSCHTKSHHYSTWEQSTHGRKKHDYFGQVTCVDCHVDPGLKGFLKAKTDGLRHLWVSLLNFPEEFKSERGLSVTLPNENCLKCHGGIKNLNYLAENDLPIQLRDVGLNIAHKTHIELTGQCLTCHNEEKSKDFSKETQEVLNFLSSSNEHYLHANYIMTCTSCHEDISHGEPKKYKKNIPLEDLCGRCHREQAKCKRIGPIFSIENERSCMKCHPNHF